MATGDLSIHRWLAFVWQNLNLFIVCVQFISIVLVIICVRACFHISLFVCVCLNLIPPVAIRAFED